MQITATTSAAIAESAEFERWFRAGRASGVRPHSRAAALAVWLGAAS